MRYNEDFRNKAAKLRKQGYSVKEIASKLSISQSTSSLWLRNIKLSPAAQKRLEKRKLHGYYKSQLIRWNKRQSIEKENNSEANKIISKIKPSKEISKLILSILYWGEGSKNQTSVKFTNSDPKMIAVFLNLFRKTYQLNEDKFRVLMHLHEYHEEKERKEYWSKITKIPTSQFQKTYIKKNTGKRIKNNYPGCIVVSYYDASIAKKIASLYNMYAQNLGA